MSEELVFSLVFFNSLSPSLPPYFKAFLYLKTLTSLLVFSIFPQFLTTTSFYHILKFEPRLTVKSLIFTLTWTNNNNNKDTVAAAIVVVVVVDTFWLREYISRRESLNAVENLNWKLQQSTCSSRDLWTLQSLIEVKDHSEVFHSEVKNLVCLHKLHLSDSFSQSFWKFCRLRNAVCKLKFLTSQKTL